MARDGRAGCGSVRQERVGQNDGAFITIITVTVPWHPRPLALRPDRRLCRFLSTGRVRGASYSSRRPVATHPSKDEPIQMTATERGLPASVTENPPGPGCPDGRVLALRCLGIPQVITRAPVSRRRALTRRLAAFCVRIRPGNTAELASLVLHMGEEIDRRERMLDAALRATAEVPGERADNQSPNLPGLSRLG